MRRLLLTIALLAVGASYARAQNVVYVTPAGGVVTAPVFILPASAVNGNGQITVPLCIGDGTTTIKQVATNDLGIYTGATACVGGTLRFDASATAATSAVPILTTTGTFSTPAISPVAYPTTGIFWVTGAAGGLRVAVDGQTNALIINNGTASVNGSFTVNSTLATLGKVNVYNGVATAGWGAPGIYGYGDVVAATNTGTASIATYTVGAADGTFEVGCNILVTTATTHSFSCDTTYTDESNVARTMVMPVVALAGTFVTTGLITNITGAGPYESPVMTIRAKAGTAITIRTSAGGTFTTVVYNARGVIKQVS